MSKSELCDAMKRYYKRLEDITNRVNKINSVQVSNPGLRAEIEAISEEWFTYSGQLAQYRIDETVLSYYNNCFRKLLRLVVKPNRKKSYLSNIESILKGFRSEIVLFLQTEVSAPFNEVGLGAEVRKMLEKIPDKEENEYLQEALGCWNSGFLKASVVLMWCACIDRIHRKIAQIGFDIFNNTSLLLRQQTKGRFKNFTKSYSVSSLSELRMAFDNDILWILEGMKLIDSNQKNRLYSCFDMRCHSGHPGAAPITTYNVLSCFSDIIEIVLSNPIFELDSK